MQGHEAITITNKQTKHPDGEIGRKEDFRELLDAKEYLLQNIKITNQKKMMRMKNYQEKDGSIILVQGRASLCPSLKPNIHQYLEN